MPTESVSLEKATRLLALIALKNLTQKEQALLMTKAGFGPSEIAALLGTTPATVNARLQELRAEGALPRRR